MSAAEKLRALGGTGPSLDMAPKESVRTVWGALPAIIAVVDQMEAFVEIHERSRQPWHEIEERLRNVVPDLLATLSQALEPGEETP